jgi:hypothetical protein
MSNDRSERAGAAPERAPERTGRPAAAWTRPGFEVIPLDCEITAYAPDGDLPLV